MSMFFCRLLWTVELIPLILMNIGSIQTGEIKRWKLENVKGPTTYLIFVHFGTLPQFLDSKKYTKNYVNSRCNSQDWSKWAK